MDPEQMEEKKTDIQGKTAGEYETVQADDSGRGKNIRDNILKLIGRKKEKQLPVVTTAVREVSFDEIDAYLELQYFNSFRLALGAMFCLDSPVVAIIVDGFDLGGFIPSGAAELFEGMSMIIFVAIAVCVYIYSAIRAGSWDFLREERCHIDDRTIRFIRMERIMYKRTYFQMTAAGIVLIIGSFVPGRIFAKISPDFIFMNNLSIALFLVLVSIGVFLILMSFFRMRSYSMLLKLNDRNPHVQEKEHEPEGGRRYSNKIIAKGMSVYWPTVTCFYIMMSFITFAWGISWVIWPMAWIVAEVIGRVFRARGDSGKE